jgi:hypothetical protein
MVALSPTRFAVYPVSALSTLDPPPIAAGHGAAEVAAADRLQQVQMRGDSGDLEEIILNAAAPQQDGGPLVLPVAGVGRVGLYAVCLVGQRFTRRWG